MQRLQSSVLSVIKNKARVTTRSHFIATVIATVLLFGFFALGTAGCNSQSDTAGPSQASRSQAQSHVRLTDITRSAGVTATYRNGQEANEFVILESLGGGIAMVDFDMDGLLDLFFPQGGSIGPDRKLMGLPSKLWRNKDGTTFQEVTNQASVGRPAFYSHGCAAGDYDNDGFLDLLVTGYGGLQLFKNCGDGTFREVQVDAGLNDTQWSSSAGWGDVNGDGDLDLYVTHYVDWSWDNNPRCGPGDGAVRDVCPPRMFEGLTDTLYLNNGDGAFRDATGEARLLEGGKGLGVALADWDSDRDLDIYVANDTTDNFFYINDGSGKFAEAGLLRGVAVDDRGIANGSMGIAVLDYNLDQLLDIWVANYENETFGLYRNEGDANFTHVSDSAGINALGQLYVGFGTIAADLDRDGDDDLVVANGHVMYHSGESSGPQQPLLLVNDAGRNFQRAHFTPDSYFGSNHWGRGLAAGDLDNDGDLDMVFTNTNEPAAILANDTPAEGKWLALRLVGTSSSRDAIGARAVLKTNAGSFTKTICSGGSYLSQNDNRLYWGLTSEAQVQSVTVYWPAGDVQEIEQPSVSTVIDLVEPRKAGP